eukprot:SAG22_NODE_20850_length_262_cov_0.638037_1_plen_47_part_01
MHGLDFDCRSVLSGLEQHPLEVEAEEAALLAEEEEEEKQRLLDEKKA